MTSERWQQITSLFQTVLEQAEENRNAFLCKACDGDEELRKEVEELIEYHEKTGEFMQAPALEIAANILSPTGDPQSGLFKKKSLKDSFTGTDRFIIEGELGEGGFGLVYKVYDRERRSLIALKSLQRAFPEALYRFKREFRALADIVHPNLVALYELMSDGAEWFFTMELIEGVDFLSYVGKEYDNGAANGESPGNFNLDRLRAALCQLAEGVYALHQAGKLHRDIKPSNVLVSREGRVVLLDFGLVTDIDLSESDRSLELVGTPLYMSPEQGSGLKISAASDWYSVGVILYKALTGQMPFTGQFPELINKKQKSTPTEPAKLLPNIPEDLDQLCMDLLKTLPQERPTGVEILARLGVQAEQVCLIKSKNSAANLPFVGREQHLAELNDAFKRVKKGRPVVVYAHGSSGMGKSTLVRHFLEDLQQREHKVVVLSGRCYEREAVPYKALDSLMDGLSRYLKNLPAVKAEILLPHDILPLTRLFPVLKQVEAVARAQQREFVKIDSRELRRRAFAALLELLVRLADRVPLVMFIDDLQWGDIDSALLLKELICHPQPPALMMILSYRSEETETSPILRMLLPLSETELSVEARRLTIGELSKTEAQNLAMELLSKDRSVSMERVAALALESGGSPFFINELVQYSQANLEQIDKQRERYSHTLDEVVQAHIATLPSNARRLLEVVAVAGQPLDLKVALEAAKIESEGQTVLSILRSGYLARIREMEGEDRIETYHDRIRETIVSHLEPIVLKDYHQSLSWALKESGKADAETLAIHLQEAGDLKGAAEYAITAAEQAAAALAFDRAVRLYKLALDLHSGKTGDNGALRINLAKALANAGRGADSAVEYLAAAKESEVAQALELQRQAAEQFLRSGRIDEGLEVVRDVLAKIGMKLASSPRRAFFSLLIRRAQIWWRGLGFRERSIDQISSQELLRIDASWSVAIGLSFVDTIHGADFQALHLLLALKAGEPYRVARALAVEANYCAGIYGKNHRQTEKLVQTSMALAKRIDHPHALGLAVSAGGFIGFLEGRWRVAYDLSVEAEQILAERCTGVTWELDMVQIFLLRALFWLGDLKELSQRLPPLLVAAQERGDLYAIANLVTRASYTARLAADEAGRAEQDVEQALKQWSRRGFHAQHYFGLVANVDIALYNGDIEKAARLVNENWSALVRSFFLRVQHLRIESYLLRSRSALAMATIAPDPETYLSAAERDARKILKEQMGWSDPLAYLVMATLYAFRGKAKRAVARLALAESGFEAANMALYAATARYRRGELTGGQEGQTLMKNVKAWMHAQKIKNPDRIIAMLTPGRWTPGTKEKTDGRRTTDDGRKK